MDSRLVLIPLLAVLALPAYGGDPGLDTIRAHRDAHAKGIVMELRELLALPNVASDAEAIERNAEYLMAMLERRGIAARTLRVPGAPPAVFGARTVPGATRTVVFYAHFDGQPAPMSQGWTSDPWTPILRDGERTLDWSALDGPINDEWRIYARSASDDKGPIVALMVALDALDAAGIAPSVNLKFFFEGEEEAGSTNLGRILEAHRELLAADLWIFCDGPMHFTRRAQVVFGVRGVIGLEMTVYGPVTALHSGNYGNWAPNPAALLAELLASMRDGEGNILIKGFKDKVRPLDRVERAAVAAAPDADDSLRHALGIARSERRNARLVEGAMVPALNIRGLRSASVGADAANAIPAEAQASIDFRLVPDVTPTAVRELVERHVRARGFHIVEEAPDAETRRSHPRIVRMQWEKGYAALRTSMSLPVSQAVIAAVEEVRGEPAVRLPNLGGSLPLSVFDEVLGVPLIIVPIVNHDNNQHGANENLRLRNLWEGIDLYANLMRRL